MLKSQKSLTSLKSNQEWITEEDGDKPNKTSNSKRRSNRVRPHSFKVGFDFDDNSKFSSIDSLVVGRVSKVTRLHFWRPTLFCHDFCYTIFSH